MLGAQMKTTNRFRRSVTVGRGLSAAAACLLAANLAWAAPEDVATTAETSDPVM